MTRRSRIALAAGLAAAALILMIVALWYTRRGGQTIVPPGEQRAFYSVDDGATWFADAEDRLPPFERDGAMAVRAYVYDCGGKPFVNHLERYTAKGREAATAHAGRGGPPAGSKEIALLYAAGREVKRPGTANWINKGDPAADAVVQPRCPDGDGTPTPVNP